MGTTSKERFSSGKRAPVIIPTCNRWQHFQNLAHSLQACPLAEQTHLYIALDAPFSEAVVEENRRILQIAEQLTGFGQVTIWKRESNLGAVRNIAEAVDQVFQNHDRLIFLEDDNVVAKNFLLFMNQAMDAFASDSRCFSVSGYHFTPVQGGVCFEAGTFHPYVFGGHVSPRTFSTPSITGGQTKLTDAFSPCIWRPESEERSTGMCCIAYIVLRTNCFRFFQQQRKS